MCHAYQIDDRLPLEHTSIPTPRKSEGGALKWFANLRADVILIWEELANLFVEQYRFNLDTGPSQLQLQNMEIREGQSFQDYLMKLRELAVDVIPPVPDREAISIYSLARSMELISPKWWIISRLHSLISRK